MLCIPQEFFDSLSGRSNLQLPPPPSPMKKEPRKLTEKEKAAGWFYDNDRMGNRTLYRKFPQNVMVNGMPHREGEKMKTWQEMIGIHSYRIMQNPHYAEALEHSAMFNYRLAGTAAMTMEVNTDDTHTHEHELVKTAEQRQRNSVEGSETKIAACR